MCVCVCIYIYIGRGYVNWLINLRNLDVHPGSKKVTLLLVLLVTSGLLRGYVGVCVVSEAGSTSWLVVEPYPSEKYYVIFQYRINILWNSIFVPYYSIS